MLSNGSGKKSVDSTLERNIQSKFEKVFGPLEKKEKTKSKAKTEGSSLEEKNSYTMDFGIDDSKFSDNAQGAKEEKSVEPVEDEVDEDNKATVVFDLASLKDQMENMKNEEVAADAGSANLSEEAINLQFDMPEDVRIDEEMVEEEDVDEVEDVDRQQQLDLSLSQNTVNVSQSDKELEKEIDRESSSEEENGIGKFEAVDSSDGSNDEIDEEALAKLKEVKDVEENVVESTISSTQDESAQDIDAVEVDIGQAGDIELEAPGEVSVLQNDTESDAEGIGLSDDSSDLEDMKVEDHRAEKVEVEESQSDAVELLSPEENNQLDKQMDEQKQSDVTDEEGADEASFDLSVSEVDDEQHIPDEDISQEPVEDMDAVAFEVAQEDSNDSENMVEPEQVEDQIGEDEPSFSLSDDLGTGPVVEDESIVEQPQVDDLGFSVNAVEDDIDANIAPLEVPEMPQNGPLVEADLPETPILEEETPPAPPDLDFSAGVEPPEDEFPDDLPQIGGEELEVEKTIAVEPDSPKLPDGSPALGENETVLVDATVVMSPPPVPPPHSGEVEDEFRPMPFKTGSFDRDALIEGGGTKTWPDAKDTNSAKATKTTDLPGPPNLETEDETNYPSDTSLEMPDDLFEKTNTQVPRSETTIISNELLKEIGTINAQMLEQHSEKLVELSTTIQGLREEREKYLKENLQLKDENSQLKQNDLGYKAELEEVKIELAIIKKRHNDEIAAHNYEKKLLEEKLEINHEKLKKYKSEFDRLQQKVRFDLSRVRGKENDLQEQIELIKSDASIQINNRDKKIVELKRKIETLEFDLESMLNAENRSKGDRLLAEEKLGRVLKILRSATDIVESDINEFSTSKQMNKLSL